MKGFPYKTQVFLTRYRSSFLDTDFPFLNTNRSLLYMRVSFLQNRFSEKSRTSSKEKFEPWSSRLLQNDRTAPARRLRYVKPRETIIFEKQHSAMTNPNTSLTFLCFCCSKSTLEIATHIKQQQKTEHVNSSNNAHTRNHTRERFFIHLNVENV